MAAIPSREPWLAENWGPPDFLQATLWSFMMTCHELIRPLIAGLVGPNP